MRYFSALRHVKNLLALLIAIGIFNCTGLGLPKPSFSEHFRTRGGGVAYNREKDKFFFTLSLSANKEIREKLFYSAEFQNPENMSEPMVHVNAISPGTRTFMILSPPFNDFKRFKNYLVTVRFFSDSSMTDIVGTHSQHIQSRMKPGAMKEMVEKSHDSKRGIN